MESIRVSPRHLGKLRSASFCPRCFWFELAIGFRPPFDSPMPGLMFNLDRFEKRLIEAHFQAKANAPRWFSQLGCTGPVEFPSKMTQEFPRYGLTLVGMPDAVFSKEDGGLCLVDYKTARYKGEDGPFMSCYETQLMGYVHLLEHHGIGEISSAALVYFENKLADYEDNPVDLLTSSGLSVPFAARIHQVEIDRDVLAPLMKSFREFADMAAPPDGAERCKKCSRPEDLLGLEQVRHNSTKSLKNMDRVALNYVLGKMARDRREAVVSESQNWESYLTDGVTVDPDCIPGAWDMQANGIP